MRIVVDGACVCMGSALLTHSLVLCQGVIHSDQDSPKCVSPLIYHSSGLSDERSGYKRRDQVIGVERGGYKRHGYIGEEVMREEVIGVERRL